MEPWCYQGLLFTAKACFLKTLLMILTQGLVFNTFQFYVVLYMCLFLN